jgi:hypothetical protein
LVVYPDQPVLQVKIRGQPAELGNAQPGSQQNDKLIGVLTPFFVYLRSHVNSATAKTAYATLHKVYKNLIKFIKSL